MPKTRAHHSSEGAGRGEENIRLTTATVKTVRHHRKAGATATGAVRGITRSRTDVVERGSRQRQVDLGVSSFTMPRHSRSALLALPFLLAACADASHILAPVPNDRPAHPGFDTSLYPGDAAMRAWRAPSSPYEWVGYYLGAPCHGNTSWLGRRAFLGSLGWGTAVLYVGQQTWEGVPTAQMSASPAARVTLSSTCSRTMLSGAQGTIEGSDAAAKTANEGFPAGTVIFLDIEYMSTITQPMRDYYRSWVAQVLADGRYLPGIYCHKSNAAAIHADVT